MEICVVVDFGLVFHNELPHFSFKSFIKVKLKCILFQDQIFFNSKGFLEYKSKQFATV